MEKSDILLEESTPLRRVGSKARMLAAALVGLVAAGREAAFAGDALGQALGAKADIRRRRNAAKAARWISRTGEPHGRSGDKLIRKAMRKQVGRAVLR